MPHTWIDDRKTALIDRSPQTSGAEHVKRILNEAALAPQGDHHCKTSGFRYFVGLGRSGSLNLAASTSTKPRSPALIKPFSAADTACSPLPLLASRGSQFPILSSVFFFLFSKRGKSQPLHQSMHTAFYHFRQSSKAFVTGVFPPSPPADGFGWSDLFLVWKPYLPRIWCSCNRFFNPGRSLSLKVEQTPSPFALHYMVQGEIFNCILMSTTLKLSLLLY
jgi:hypothetical protein